jgi:hypothetical protein
MSSGSVEYLTAVAFPHRFTAKMVREFDRLTHNPITH